MNDNEMLRSIKKQALMTLDELLSVPKPSYTIDGNVVSWTDYQQQLINTINWCDSKIGQDEPFEFHTKAES